MAKAVSKLSTPGRRKLTVLTLGPKEAQYLRNLVGGQIKGKAAIRVHNTSIRKALQSAGVNYVNDPSMRGYVFLKAPSVPGARAA
jgi:hypothetical protein